MTHVDTSKEAGRDVRGRRWLFVAIGLGLASAAPLLLAVAAIMMLVGLVAAFGPARRGVRIQAIEALRAEG